MPTLIFILTILCLIVLIIKILVNLTKQKSIKSSLRLFLVIISVYTLLWAIFYFKSTQIIVPPGTDVCFDDWCATITKSEHMKMLGDEKPKGQFIIIHLRMSNHARGIAQKPSEPRVHIIDDQGHSFLPSQAGQIALEKLTGKQLPLDSKLELDQSLETQIVFDIPGEVKNAIGLIEEGPFITQLLLHDNREVFKLDL